MFGWYSGGVAAYIRCVMNNSVSSTVVIEFFEMKWIISKLAGLTLVGVCMLHSLAVDWVRECVAGCVICEPSHTEDLCQRPSVLWSIWYICKSLHVESFPTIHFFPLLHGINNSSVSAAVLYLCLLFSICNAYAEIGLLVLMYYVCSLCLVTIDWLIVLHMNCCKCYY